ncbi:uncharacterized protein LOC123884911 isoform X2 [Trifolium pratense]|uniref:uncharacterized protein LOC123884911 isoform X2 n=1 Tax=Trifolium pratense TaxID=57577 RepID=UPI001E69529A|nr:uncharacterized protein LOC123884911 isoform X2 [Trifolium pratense]
MVLKFPMFFNLMLLQVSEDIKFDVLRGLTNSLLAAKKPDEAVQFLLAYREHLSSEDFSKKYESSPTDSQPVSFQKAGKQYIQNQLRKF